MHLLTLGANPTAVKKSLVRRLHLLYITRHKTRLQRFSNGLLNTALDEIMRLKIETARFTQRIFAHVIDRLDKDMFLGKPWYKANDIVYYAREQRLYHQKGGIELRLVSKERSAQPSLSLP